MADDPIVDDRALLLSWTRIIMALTVLLAAMWGLDIGMDDLQV